VEQARRLGTGHAVVQGQAAFEGRGGDEWSGRRFGVLCGDTPLLTAAGVGALLATHARGRGAVVLLAGQRVEPSGGGGVREGRGENWWTRVRSCRGRGSSSAAQESGSVPDPSFTRTPRWGAGPSSAKTA